MAPGISSRRKPRKRVADGQIDIAADKPARISAPVQWGRYRLEVSTADRNGPVTSVDFDAGWYAEASADTPDLLEIALDKAEYATGESMTVAVTARTAGKVTLHVIGDRLVSTVTQDVTAGTARLRVPVGNDWGSGAYVVATLRRPLDARAERMPGRAIGVQWFSINRKARTLALDMPLPTLLRPNSTLRVPVKVAGLAPGEDARIVVAAVDVGILNLTNYKPPAPDDYYLGQRRLTADIRDLYGQLIDGMQGTARTDQDGWRRRRRRAAGLAAYAEAARALFRHRHRQARRHRRNRVRHSGLCRHRAGDGRRLVQGQGRPRRRRRDHPRSGGSHGDAAAVPAQRRPRHDASRSRQCGRRGRRLPSRDEERRRQRLR